jgi:hypothetical protein
MSMMLPVTTDPPGHVGAWASPYGRPRTIELRRHNGHYVLPKGVWMVRTGPNRVELLIRDRDWWDDLHRAPGTGLIRPGPRPRKPPPPCPPSPCPPEPGHNSDDRLELVRMNHTGVVFADGMNAVITGAGDALIIKVR